MTKTKPTINQQELEIIEYTDPVSAKSSNKLKKTEESSSKYMMQGGFIHESQLLQMMQRTPKAHIFKRPGKGGQVWEFVTGTYVKKILNYVFGWNWDFEIVSHEEKYGQVIVEGKLTVRAGKHAVVKMQYGRADIKFKKGTKDAVDYGNDLKAATTDALKKCAAELGIANDIYGKNEFKELKKPEVKKGLVDQSSTQTDDHKWRNKLGQFLKDNPEVLTSMDYTDSLETEELAQSTYTRLLSEITN